MTLSPIDRQAIIDYRLEKGLKTLAEAKYVANGNFWSLTAWDEADIVPIFSKAESLIYRLADLVKKPE